MRGRHEAAAGKCKGGLKDPPGIASSAMQMQTNTERVMRNPRNRRVVVDFLQKEVRGRCSLQLFLKQETRDT